MSSIDTTFERALAEHQAGVLRVCRAVLRDEHLGADAAQETFVRLFESLRERRAPERFGSWLRSVALSVSLDLLRRRGARDAAHGRAAKTSELDAQAGPDRAADDAELSEGYERALTLLPEGQRTIFLLRHSGGLSLREIAELLGVTLPTVKTQFARAVVRLQRELRPFRDEEDDR
jgi:RNA polymerase sigma-70 factor (ECF subfamily)